MLYKLLLTEIAIIIFIDIMKRMGFPGGQTVKNLPATQEDLGWIPRLSPREGNGYPLQYSCLENSMDRKVRVAKSQT